MLKRKKIGLPFLGNYKTWAGGVIYTINIISALRTLPDDEKPELFIYHFPDSPIKDLKEIDYPYIKFCSLEKEASLPIKVLNYISVKLFSKSFLFKEIPEVCYPAWRMLPVGKKPIYWIPDFQEHYLPQMFSQKEILERKKMQLNISNTKSIVVFSSEDAKNDFEQFYPKNKNELKLLRFASTLPSFNHININSLKEKYNLKNIYFFSPNQFWQHKNHIVVLKAIAFLKPKNLNFQVVFSGSENDHRNKTYFQELKNFIKDNAIESWIKFIGFIDRKDQLQLMNNAQAIIQPSLFEGWSTVVEDTKAMSQFILISNLKVHREQLNTNCLFFEPDDFTYLALLIEKSLLQKPSRLNIDYQQSITHFAKNFLKIVSHE
jgi:glycosyltransferase involved in cell wall biosynthesis